MLKRQITDLIELYIERYGHKDFYEQGNFINEIIQIVYKDLYKSAVSEYFNDCFFKQDKFTKLTTPQEIFDYSQTIPDVEDRAKYLQMVGVYGIIQDMKQWAKQNSVE